MQDAITKVIKPLQLEAKIEDDDEPGALVQREPERLEMEPLEDTIDDWR